MGARIEPWLSVSDGRRAVEYYRLGLGAADIYRLEEGGRVVVARLDVEGATFWVQEDVESGKSRPGKPARMFVTVDDPDAWHRRAIAAGARELVPVTEEHGWRTGRVSDPFGHDWEFSRPAPPEAAS